MKINFIILATIIFQSCCTTNINVVGKYASKTNPSCFQFKEDSTYIYEFRKFDVYEYSTGHWGKINNRTIELNSGISSTVVPLKVVEFESAETNRSALSVSLNIKGGLQLADYKCEIYINDVFYEAVRCDSLSSVIVNETISNIYFKFNKQPQVVTSTLISLPLISERYEYNKNGYANLKFEVLLDDSFFSYRPFNKEEVKVSKGFIKYYYNKKWEKIPRVPDETKIFIHF